METGEIFISNQDGVHQIRVKGNASFVCAPPLRELAKKLPGEPFNGLRIDLEECTWMDSTFMGMLAMLGLNAKKKGMKYCSAWDRKWVGAQQIAKSQYRRGLRRKWSSRRSGAM